MIIIISTTFPLLLLPPFYSLVKLCQSCHLLTLIFDETEVSTWLTPVPILHNMSQIVNEYFKTEFLFNDFQIVRGKFT